MRPKHLSSVLVAAACAVGVASVPATAPAAQRAEETQPAQGQPAQPASASGESARDKAPPAAQALIPLLEIEDMPFEQLVEHLRDLNPNFQAVVAFAPGAAPGPTIQDLRLRNVSAPTVLRLISQTYEQVRVEEVDEDGQRFWTVRVAPARQRDGGDGGGGLFGDVRGRAGGDARVTRLFRLTEPVDDATRGDTTRDAAREAVMSLLQSALESDLPAPAAKGRPGTPLPLIKLHEPTETLVFTGTEAQAGLVAEALSTLGPPVSGSSDHLKRLVVVEERLARLEQALKRSEDAKPRDAGGTGAAPDAAPGEAPPTSAPPAGDAKQPEQPNR